MVLRPFIRVYGKWMPSVLCNLTVSSSFRRLGFANLRLTQELQMSEYKKQRIRKTLSYSLPVCYNKRGKRWQARSPICALNSPVRQGCSFLVAFILFQKLFDFFFRFVQIFTAVQNHQNHFK